MQLFCFLLPVATPKDTMNFVLLPICMVWGYHNVMHQYSSKVTHQILIHQ